MIAAPHGVPGSLLIGPFLRMAQGQNELNEHNTAPGVWTHGDGWGAVFQGDDGRQVVRSVEACWDDARIEPLRDRRILLLHARRASQGRVVLENTHPFREAIGGESWFFCHNGTVRGLELHGRTDSQEVFDRLLPFVRDGRILPGLREVYGAIDDFTSLNSYLLGPDALWVVSLCTKDPTYYELALTETEFGPIVSSEPLPALAGERTEIPSGRVVYVDRRSGAVETYMIDA